MASHNRFPRVLHEYNVRLVREAEAANKRRLAELKTKADAEAYVRDLRERIFQNALPSAAKTPLNPRITGKLERGAYTIEKVIFESRPGFPATGEPLCFPTQARTRRAPGVVIGCGHYPEAKAAEPYQSVAQGLARLGYVAFIFDPWARVNGSSIPTHNSSPFTAQAWTSIFRQATSSAPGR